MGIIEDLSFIVIKGIIIYQHEGPLLTHCMIDIQCHGKRQAGDKLFSLSA